MPTIDTPSHSLDKLAHAAADKADAAIGSARNTADAALDSLQDKAERLAAAAPGTFSRVAAQIDDLTRRGIDGARAAADTARTQASRAGDRTVAYIKDEPVKSVLIAAAAGAALVALCGLMKRSASVDRR